MGCRLRPSVDVSMAPARDVYVAVGDEQVLTTCRHDHLVPLLGICVDPTPMLVYPFVGQSLEWHLREPQRRAAIGWSTRLSVALSVSKGLQVWGSR